MTATWAVRYDYITHYCKTKGEAEAMCADFARLGLPAVVFLIIRGNA